MADDRELEEFRAWKASQEKERIFGVLDEWADRSGLKGLIEAVAGDEGDEGGEGDEGDEDGGSAIDLADAARRIRAGAKVKPPKGAKQPPPGDGDPEPEPKSIAARIFG